MRAMHEHDTTSVSIWEIPGVCDPGEKVDVSLVDWGDQIQVSMCGDGKLNLSWFNSQVTAMNGDVAATNGDSLQGWFGSLGGVKEEDGQYFLHPGGRVLEFQKVAGSENFWVRYVDVIGSQTSAELSMGQITDLVNGSLVTGSYMTQSADTTTADPGAGVINRFVNAQVLTGETVAVVGDRPKEVEIAATEGVNTTFLGLCSGLGVVLLGLAAWKLFRREGAGSGFSSQQGVSADWQDAAKMNYGHQSSASGGDTSGDYGDYFYWDESTQSANENPTSGVVATSEIHGSPSGGGSGMEVGFTLQDIATNVANVIHAAEAGHDVIDGVAREVD